MENTIRAFIKDNNLSLTETNSALNSTFTILCGYACHLDIEEDLLVEIIDKIKPLSRDEEKQLRKVYYYASKNSYKDFWKEEAKSIYQY